MIDKEAIIKNVLGVLFSKTSLLPEEKRLFSDLCRELSASTDEYQRWNTEWRAKPQTLIVRKDKATDEATLTFMIAAAYFDNMVYSGERAILVRFCRESERNPQPVERFLAHTWTFDFADGIGGEARDIGVRLAAGGNGEKPLASPRRADAIIPTGADSAVTADGQSAARTGDSRRSAAKPTAISNYVATQVGKEGIDELQALIVCSRLSLNAALSGPPGIGKTESVRELANILEIPLFTKMCSSRTSESHIISHPVLLERNGATITAHEDGALCRAMLAPGIFYGDEYNLLKEDVQKRMNSAFDDRRSIDRNDGSLVTAKPGFMAVISYNPSKDIGRRDLEDSVADRFVHLRFNEWPSELRAFISMLRAEARFGRVAPKFEEFGIKLEKRAIDSTGNFLREEDGEWRDFFTGQTRPIGDEAYCYWCRLPRAKTAGASAARARSALDAGAFKTSRELSLAYSSLVDTVNELAATGKAPILKTIGLGEKTDDDDWETMYVHRCSTRIVAAALSHYAWFQERGWGVYAAQAYGTRLIIDQMAYGAFAEQRLRNVANTSILESIAKALKLITNDTVYPVGS